MAQESAAPPPDPEIGQDSIVEEQGATAPPRSILLDPRAPGPYYVPELALPEFEEDTAEQPAEAPPSDGLSGGEIEVGTLESETTTVGVLGPDSGGFSSFLWDDSDGKTVLRLLSLAAPGQSRAMQGLTRRLLLTAAPPPPGVDADDFLAARLHQLAAIGDLDGILELVNRAGSRRDMPGAERIKVDALLLAEDYVGACGYAADKLRGGNDPYWLQVVTFCRALNEDRPGANLSLELLQEQAVEAPVFYKLISALLQRTADSEPPVVASMEAPSALLVAMAGILDVALPGDVVVNAPPMVLTKLAGLAEIPIDLRLTVAEAAARVGGFPPDRLAQIYAAIPFSDADRSNAALLAETAEDARANALLYQAALGAGSEMDRAVVLKTGAARARQAQELALYAAINREALVTLPPSDAVLPLAPDLVRLLLLAGEREAALGWYRYVRDAGVAGNADARTALVQMWPLVVVGNGGGEVPVSPDILDLWWQSRQGVPQETSAVQAEILYALFEALGHGIPDTFWPQLMGSADAAPVAMPSLPVWRGLLKAAAEGHVGETVVYALATLAEGGAAQSAPTVLSSVIRALRTVGLDGDARAIALEAMIAHGL